MDYKLKTIDYYSPAHKNLYKSIAWLIQPINSTYPNHEDWLFNKFIPGLKNGSRKMVVAYKDLHNPMGIALLKDTKENMLFICSTRLPKKRNSK